MNQGSGWIILARTAATICLVSPVVLAQSPPTGQTAAQNSHAGSVHNRAPGLLVSAGVARAMEFANRGRAGVEIVETELPLTPHQQVLITTLETAFDELNQALLALRALLLARAGAPVAVPSSTTGGITSPGTTNPTVLPRGGRR